jgi:tetratricopeptide (TPR) repeat protein
MRGWRRINPKSIIRGTLSTESAPDSPLHNYLLAKLLEKDVSGDHSRAINEAIGSALAAVKLKPKFVEARDLLASLYQQSSQYALAIERCHLALRYAPSDQSAMYHLITLFRHSGKSGDCEKIQGLVKRLSEA